MEWIFKNLIYSEERGRPYLMSWIHSHVRGNECQFSSIDVHTQFSMDRLYDGITGIVIKISSDGNCDAYNVFKLTTLGQQKIYQCKEDSTKQHGSCSSKKFYKSVRRDLSMTGSLPLKIQNFYQQQGFQQCKGCEKMHSWLCSKYCVEGRGLW